MRRRTFLKAATAAAVAGPIFLGTTARAMNNKPVIGVDGHKYECDHEWAKLPTDLEWQTTHNIAIDSQGLIYITHQGIGKKMDTILVFDKEGKFVRSFGKEFHGGGHGIEIRKEGSDEFAYLSNTWTPDLKIMKTTLKGEVVWKKGKPETKEYQAKDAKYSPTNICFTPDGGFIVGDGYGSAFIMSYDKDGNVKNTFGGAGKDDGKFRTPHGQWVDDRDKANPKIVVCDRGNNRLCFFDMSGKFLSATNPNAEVLFPAHVKTKGDVMMVADVYCRVSLFDKNNKLIVSLGEQTEDDIAYRKKAVASMNDKTTTPLRTRPKDWTPGRFVTPHDATFDSEGNIFVAEWVVTGRVTKLKKVG